MRSGRNAFGTDDLVVFCLFAKDAFERPDQGVGEGPWLIAITIFWFLYWRLPRGQKEVVVPVGICHNRQQAINSDLIAVLDDC